MKSYTVTICAAIYCSKQFEVMAENRQDAICKAVETAHEESLYDWPYDGEAHETVEISNESMEG